MTEEETPLVEGDDINENIQISQTVEKLLKGSNYATYESPEQLIYLSRIDTFEDGFDDPDYVLEYVKNWNPPVFKVEIEAKPAAWPTNLKSTPYGQLPNYFLDRRNRLWRMANSFYVDQKGQGLINEDVWLVNLEGQTIKAFWETTTGQSFDQALKYKGIKPAENDSRCIPLNKLQQDYLLRELSKVDAQEGYTQIR